MDDEVYETIELSMGRVGGSKAGQPQVKYGEEHTPHWK
jgi:hypothetical protein